jgi:hypothetical protein
MQPSIGSNAAKGGSGLVTTSSSVQLSSLTAMRNATLPLYTICMDRIIFLKNSGVALKIKPYTDT